MFAYSMHQSDVKALVSILINFLTCSQLTKSFIFSKAMQ
jgi:hypothetical protein